LIGAKPKTDGTTYDASAQGMVEAEQALDMLPKQ